MPKSIYEYEKNFESNPGGFIIKLIFFIVLLAAIIGGVSYIFSVFSDAGNVAKKEYSVSAMLKKYEWFKDASAQLDKKRADILVYEKRVENLEVDYKDTPRTKWAREDREQYNIWTSEVAGLKASYNDLAAQYNSAMSKFNYAFANKGSLPEGAVDPLPREYKPYVTQ